MSITETTIDFNTFEKKIYAYYCAKGREMLRDALEGYDGELRLSRDFKAYRHKGTRKTVIKTVMGEVEFRRAVYETHDDEGRKSYVYLLDDALGRSGSGFFSEFLSEEIARACCNGSYRNAAREVSELTGQTLSHTAAWNVVQNLGERVDAQESQAAALAAKNEGVGTVEAKLLFEEQDGVWLHLQGKDREEHGKSKEMKLAIAYNGAEKKGKKRYELTNKVACANFESVGKFQKRKEGIIAQTYNVDEIEKRFLNGDGASWIKRAITDDNVYFQLDPFHRNKAIVSAAPDANSKKTMLKLLYAKKIDELLTYIDALANSVEDEAAQTSLRALYTYFVGNRDGLVPCHRKGLAVPAPPDGVEFRHMGAMESNVFTIIGNRMKGRRACWSVDGGNNLARLLCLKSTAKLHDSLQKLSSASLPEKYTEEINVAMSSAKAPKADGKGFEPCHAGALPATPKWKAMRGIGKAMPMFS